MTDVLFTPLRLNELEALIENSVKRALLPSKEPKTDTDRWFDLPELCAYLPDKPSKATVYGWVHSQMIPCHKGAKKLRFLKSEIDAWLLTGKRKTVAQAGQEAEEYLTKRK